MVRYLVRYPLVFVTWLARSPIRYNPEMRLSLLLVIPLVLAFRGVGISNTLQQEDPVAESIERLIVKSIERLQGPDPIERLRAVETLGTLRTEAAERCVPPLIRCLSDADDRVREAAVAALCAMPEHAKPACLEAVEDPARRTAALLALVKMDGATSEELKALFERVECAPGILRAWALVGFPKVGEILRGFERPELEAATWEALALVAWTHPLLPAEVPEVVNEIGDPARRRMVHCLLTGGRFGESATVEDADDLLGSEHAILRRMGARALGLDPGVVPGSVDLLLPLLEDADEDVSMQAFWGLHRQDTRPTQMKSYFEAILSREFVQEPSSRRVVKEPQGLFGGRFGSESTRWDRLAYHHSRRREWVPEVGRDPILPDLQRTTDWLASPLRSKSRRVWYAALWTLYRFAPLEPETLGLLVTVFDHGDSRAREQGARFATDLAWAGLKGWSEPARVLAEDPDPGVRQQAARLLLADAHPGGRELLVECLGHDDGAVRVGAVNVLLRREDVGDPFYERALKRAFQAGTLEAGAALVQQGPDAMLTYVELLCDESIDLEIRGMCIACLGELGADARPSLPLLGTFRGHENVEIRKVTRRAMRRIEDHEKGR